MLRLGVRRLAVVLAVCAAWAAGSVGRAAPAFEVVDPADGGSLFRNDSVTIRANNGGGAGLSHLVFEVETPAGNPFFTLWLTNNPVAIKAYLLEQNASANFGVTMDTTFAGNAATGTWVVVLNTSHPAWQTALAGAVSDSFDVVVSVADATGGVAAVSLDYNVQRFVRCDFNRDGLADPAILREGNGKIRAQLSVIGADPSAWTRRVNTPTGGVDWIPAVSDYDGDGAADPTWYIPAVQRWLVFGSVGASTYGDFDEYARNVPASRFGREEDRPLNGDFDGDGRDDVSAFSYANGTITVLCGELKLSQGGSAAWRPAPGDYDGDGTNDVAWYIPSSGKWSIHLSSLGGAELTPRPTMGGPNDRPRSGDFDGDGRADLVLRRTATGRVQVKESSGGAAWSSAEGNTEWKTALADYDGDGRTDLAWFTPSTQKWRVFLSTSNLDYTVEFTPRPEFGNPASVPAPADYDGDGSAELAVYNPGSGRILYRSLFGGPTTTSAVAVASGVAVPADYDGDGKADLAWWANGQWRIVESATGTERTPAPFLGRSGDSVVPGDYNGDGKADVAVVLGADGNYRICLGNTWRSALGAPDWIPALADYDGDGKTDLAWFVPDTGKWRILESGNAYAERLPRPDFGNEEDIPLPADYDGDGKADLAVRKPNGQISVARTSANEAPWRTAIPDAEIDDVVWLPAPGDYNGDGRTDFGWYRTGNGKFVILPSDVAHTAANATLGDASVCDLAGGEEDYPVIVRHLTSAKGGSEVTLPLGPIESLGAGRLSSVWTDSRNQPHVVGDGATWLYMYDKIGGSWQNNSFNAGLSGASQYFNPHIEIDPVDRAWVSGCVFGSRTGMGIVTRRDVATSPVGRLFDVVSIQGVWDQGNLSLDPGRPNEAIASSANGIYQRLAYNPSGVTSTGGGTMYAGQGGEKNSFWISKAGDVLHPDGTRHAVWHGAIGGWSGWSSSYQNSMRAARSWPTVTWAEFSQYSAMNDDGCYVDLVSDVEEPELAYITSDFGAYRGVCMNIYNGSGMVFPASSLLTVDVNGTSGLRRYPPQLSPARGGGAFITWTSGSSIMLKYISPNGQNNGASLVVGSGGMSSIHVDVDGHIHLVYNIGSSLVYRYIKTR